MVEVYKLVARVARLDTTVLIQGETGTGKELVARAIHYASPRAGGPFVVVDCAALPETLFESELFGHERGAFTGALSARRGLLETAAGGTCLLDEIGELSLGAPGQAPAGAAGADASAASAATSWIPVNVRIIAATNRDLRKRVRGGRVPRGPLLPAERGHHRGAAAARARRRRSRSSPSTSLDRFARAARTASAGSRARRSTPCRAYHWPGNVRELENAIERAVALSSSEVLMPEDLPRASASERRPARAARPSR